MSAPRRIQLSRKKGHQKPPGVVVVARPTKWGNPLTIQQAIEAEYDHPQRACVSHYTAWIEGHNWYDDVYHLGRYSFDRRWVHAHFHELAGKDLACWCAPDSPCHADTLLRLANVAPSDRNRLRMEKGGTSDRPADR